MQNPGQFSARNNSDGVFVNIQTRDKGLEEVSAVPRESHTV